MDMQNTFLNNRLQKRKGAGLRSKLYDGIGRTFIGDLQTLSARSGINLDPHFYMHVNDKPQKRIQLEDIARKVSQTMFANALSKEVAKKLLLPALLLGPLLGGVGIELMYEAASYTSYKVRRAPQALTQAVSSLRPQTVASIGAEIKAQQMRLLELRREAGEIDYQARTENRSLTEGEERRMAMLAADAERVKEHTSSLRLQQALLERKQQGGKPNE